jgi:hypothetical protein
VDSTRSTLRFTTRLAILHEIVHRYSLKTKVEAEKLYFFLDQFSLEFRFS